MIYLQLFYEFFTTGLFAIGGGLATLPFLSRMADNYPWFTQQMLTDMVAISESTPGPIGINMSTYAGYNASGILGAFVATASIVLPSVIIMIIIAKFLKKFSDNPLVQREFYALRPAVTGLIAAAAFVIMKTTFTNINIDIANVFEYFNFINIGLFAVLLFCMIKFKKIHPLWFIVAGAVLGIVFQLK